MENKQTESEPEEIIDARAIIFNEGKQNLFLLVRGPHNMWELPGEIISGRESEIESTLKETFEKMDFGQLEFLPNTRYQSIINYLSKERKNIPVRFSVGAIKGGSNACPKLNERYRECKWVPYESALKCLPSSQQQRAYSPQQPPQKEIFEEICRINGLRPF